jgi:hypothetical protein
MGSEFFFRRRMKDLKIDPEFQSLIFPLADSEKELLEKSLIEEGCRDALIIWRGILLDGHHRFEICQRYEIEFETREIELEDRATAKIWILNNQLARRNLTPFQRAEITLRLKPLIADKAKEKQGMRTDLLQNSAKSYKPIDTREELASTAGVSHDTIWKTEKILESKPDEKILDELRQGEKSINSVFNELKRKETREKEAAAARERERIGRPPSGKFPEGKTGQTRDKAARGLGTSGSTLGKRTGCGKGKARGSRLWQRRNWWKISTSWQDPSGKFPEGGDTRDREIKFPFRKISATGVKVGTRQPDPRTWGECTDLSENRTSLNQTPAHVGQTGRIHE